MPGMRTVTIDAAAPTASQPDMAVIAPRGVVGRVIDPLGAHAARVQLIIDRNGRRRVRSSNGARRRDGGRRGGDPPLRME